ncbi:MAG TPA: hypothetical protein VEU47_05445 [Candidatus Cybelea sp.]|nr:hypothetical protein [Candidatus Cybelea sp.]
MKPVTCRLGGAGTLAAAIAFSAISLVHPMPASAAEDGSPNAPPMMDHAMPGHDQMQGMTPEQHRQHMLEMHGDHAMKAEAATPTMPGQDAFGTVQEIVRILEADPKTDWSKVRLRDLREHLIDMNEVTLKADAREEPVDGGLRIAVTGNGRTLAAIQRMIPAHAHELNQLNGWNAKAEPVADGVLLTVTSSDPGQVQHIQGLGFIGLLVSGSHHQRHHLAMAKGEFSHAH